MSFPSSRPVCDRRLVHGGFLLSASKPSPPCQIRCIWFSRVLPGGKGRGSVLSAGRAARARAYTAHLVARQGAGNCLCLPAPCWPHSILAGLPYLRGWHAALILRLSRSLCDQYDAGGYHFTAQSSAVCCAFSVRHTGKVCPSVSIWCS